jgi:hypothetical protein
MDFRMERRFTVNIKSRHFSFFLTLCLLSSTVASAHNTVLTLRQDDAANTIPMQQQAVEIDWFESQSASGKKHWDL